MVLISNKIIKLLIDLLSQKVVYVARNPKDVIVSFYYHHRLVKFQGCEGSVDDFAQYFIVNEGKLIDILDWSSINDSWNQ